MKRIISFKTNNNNWIKHLEPNDIFASPSFIIGSLHFKGSIDIDRFIDAMNESFKDYELLLASIKLDHNNIPFIKYIDNIDIDILEINEMNNNDIETYYNNNNNSNESLNPNKVINLQQQSGCAIDINDMKMSAFKLTTFSNGFIIGYNISHTLFDQAAICYYFKYLSQIYTNGNRDNITLKKPKIINYSTLFNNIGCNNSIKFNDFNESAKYSINSMGFFYYPDISNEAKSNLKTFSNNIVLQVTFNTNDIDLYKGKSNEILSKNDIITATLFKLFTFTSLLKDDDIFYLKYISNIRKHAKLDEESLGNLYKYNCIPLKVSDIRVLSIIELAIINHNHVKDINIHNFKSDIEWYKYTQDQNHDNFGYFSQSINFTILSNWVQCSYDHIKFDSSIPYSLKPICAAAFGTNFISFDTNHSNNQRIISTTISIPPDSINSIIELGSNTNLFKIIQQINK